MSRLNALALSLIVTLTGAAVVAAQDNPPPRAQKATATASAVNINTATVADLQKLPGIGAATAARIIEYRQKNGPFKKPEEILETSRFCPYSLSVFDLWCLPSVSGSRQKSQQISRCVGGGGRSGGRTCFSGTAGGRRSADRERRRQVRTPRSAPGEGGGG